MVVWGRELIQTVSPDLARCEVEADGCEKPDRIRRAASGCHAASTHAMARTGSKAETALAEPYQPTRQERAALEALLVRKIREAGVLSSDVVVGQDYPPTERGSNVVEDVFAEEPARLAWLGKLICLVTALMTATSVWALVG
jgi:hypothetical protein